MAHEQVNSEASGGTYGVRFDDNALAARLFGPCNAHLTLLEQRLDVRIAQRGNELTIEGDAASEVQEILQKLYQRLASGREVERADVLAAINFRNASGSGAVAVEATSANTEFRTPRRVIEPRNPAQKHFIRALKTSGLAFGLGPAGTGKTYLAVAAAVEAYHDKRVERIILSRPAVEAGERLGFLPGDMKDKVDPYLRPLYDALYDMIPADKVTRHIGTGDIEVAPLAFMRGRTLADAFVVLDEAQNCTVMQMKMFLTRLGEHSSMAITGDPSQVDLPPGQLSGLGHAVRILSDIPKVGITRFSASDVVRHPLVGRIIDAYDTDQRRKRAGAGTPDLEPED